MPQLGTYSRLRMLVLINEGLSNKAIVNSLKKEGINVSRSTVWRFKKHVHETGSIMPSQRSGRKPKLESAHLDLMEDLMNENSELTAIQLKEIFEQCNVFVSKAIIRKERRLFGWTYRKAAYCQLITSSNIQKRLLWAKAHVADNFHDVIWSDETTVQLETHKRLCCRKKGASPQLKPRAKHPTKVHVWGGITWNGATAICIFTGIMDAKLYVEILEKCLLPSLGTHAHRVQHRFMQDNDPKHTSKIAQKFFKENGINWWRTPPQSPDLNPIENLWHELKVIWHTCMLALVMFFRSIFDVKPSQLTKVNWWMA